MDHVKGLEGGPPIVESFGVLRRLVEAHVQDEEQNLLPKLRWTEQAKPAELDTLGAPILQAKQRGG